MKIPWRKKWQPSPVFLPGKSHGQRSLVGYSPWGCKRVRHNLVTKQFQQPSHNFTALVKIAYFYSASKKQFQSCQFCKTIMIDFLLKKYSPQDNPDTSAHWHFSSLCIWPSSSTIRGLRPCACPQSPPYFLAEVLSSKPSHAVIVSCKLDFFFTELIKFLLIYLFLKVCTLSVSSLKWSSGRPGLYRLGSPL